MHDKQIPLIVYVRKDHCAEKLWDFIHTQSRYGQVEIYFSLDKLFKRFIQNVAGNMVAVLLIYSRWEIVNIVKHEELFFDNKIVLVLPGGSNETLALGNALYPRFVSFIDDDFRDITLALRKMMARIQSQPTIY